MTDSLLCSFLNSTPTDNKTTDRSTDIDSKEVTPGAVKVEGTAAVTKRPPFRSSQKENDFALIIDVKHIDPFSIKVDWGKTTDSSRKVRDLACAGVRVVLANFWF